MNFNIPTYLDVLEAAVVWRLAPTDDARKPALQKAETILRGNGDPPILRLPLEGRVKRGDIRRAVLAVRDEKTANGDV